MSHSLRYRWTGAAWEPLARFAQRCQQVFAVGQIADLEVTEERSDESHGHYFACILAAWRNLPETYGDRFGTEEKIGSEILRHWCLIKAGFRKEQTIICPSKSWAMQAAALADFTNPFAVVQVHGSILTVWIAKSQKLLRNGGDMDKKEFEASKEAVLRICSEMVGVDVTTLRKQESPSLAPAHVPDRALVKERA